MFSQQNIEPTAVWEQEAVYFYKYIYIKQYVYKQASHLIPYQVIVCKDKPIFWTICEGGARKRKQDKEATFSSCI